MISIPELTQLQRDLLASYADPSQVLARLGAERVRAGLTRYLTPHSPRLSEVIAVLGDDGALGNVELASSDASGAPTIAELEGLWGPAGTPPRPGPGAPNRRVFIPNLGTESPLFLMISADIDGWPSDASNARVARLSFGFSRV